MSKLDELTRKVKEDPSKVKEAVNEATGLPSFNKGQKVQIVHGLGMAIAGTPATYQGEANAGYALVKTEDGQEVPVPLFCLQARENDNK